MNKGYHIPYRIVLHWLKNVIKRPFGRNGILKPYFATYYVTFRCNLSCSFCDDGNSARYPDIPCQEMDTEQAKQMLGILVKDCPSIYFTGGEPTIRSDIVELCRFSKAVGFRPVSLNTNGFLLHKREAMFDHIDQLVVSLNTLDLSKYSKMVGVNEEVARKIHANIVHYAGQQERRAFNMTINCVVNEETIADTPALMEFCFDHNLSFSLVPRITENYPDKRLKGNPAWERLVDYVLEQKKQGKRVFNSEFFLHSVRRFTNFDCCPTLVPHVYPTGQLLYPCQKIQSIKCDINEIGSYRKAINRAREQAGPIPQCDNRCHLACYMESSMITQHPLRYFLHRYKRQAQ